MPAPTSPVIKGWELGIRLREYREQAGLTAVQVGKHIGCTQAHVSVIESGRPKLTAERLDQLCKLYDISKTEAAELRELRQDSVERGWWHEYSGMFSAELQRFFGLEAGAEQVRGYHCEVIDGLLQTEDYARALIAGGSPHIRLTEVERRVKARMLRQQRLTGDNPIQVSALLSQSTLLYQVGGPEVLRKQLLHLAALVKDHDNIDVRVVPFSAGAHPALGGPYQILSFSSPRLHDIVWQEILTATNIVDAPQKITEYVMTFAEVSRRAMDQRESAALIRQTAKEL